MVTIESIKTKILELRDLRLELARHNAAGAELEAKHGRLKGELTGLLKDVNEKSFKCEFGTITKVTDLSVTMPQGEEKEKFFNFLRERGVFEQYATVNYQTLNAYYKEQKKIWEEENRDDPIAALNFDLPGIKDAKTFETIRFTKGKEETHE